MVRYNVTLTDEERKELQLLIQKGGKGYRIRHAQILLKLDQIPENREWTYDRTCLPQAGNQHRCKKKKWKVISIVMENVIA